MVAGVSPVLVDEYDEHGVVVLRGILSTEAVELLRRGIDAVVASPSSRAKVASRDDDPGFFLEDFCRWREHAEFREFLDRGELVEAARLLMRSTTVRMYHDHVLVKEAGTRQRTPWHQDQPYYDVEGRQNVSFWIPVDPVPAEYSLEVWRGSHRGPWFTPRSFRDEQARWFPEGHLAELPDIESDRDSFDIAAFAVEPGDAVAFHMGAVHGAPGFPGPGRRRVFSLRLLGDDMVHAPRPWVCSPDLASILVAECGADDRIAGAPLTGDWFPLLG